MMINTHKQTNCFYQNNFLEKNTKKLIQKEYKEIIIFSIYRMFYNHQQFYALPFELQNRVYSYLSPHPISVIFKNYFKPFYLGDDPHRRYLMCGDSSQYYMYPVIELLQGTLQRYV